MLSPNSSGSNGHPNTPSSTSSSSRQQPFFKVALMITLFLAPLFISVTTAAPSPAGSHSGSSGGAMIPGRGTNPDVVNIVMTAGGATTTEEPILFTKTYPYFFAGEAATDTFTVQDTLQSPSFPDPEYVKLLSDSMLFYEAQRSGKLPADQRVKWRNDSALDDGKDANVDLSGGYYDAGDYLKFIFPLTFSLTEVCWGALEYFDGYTLSNQTAYLDQMIRWGTDWLIKAHPNNNTLYVQVGVSEVDNNYWGPDTNIPKPRPSYLVSNTSPGTDVMADAAAAFASCSMVYRDKLNDPTYAATLFSHAEALYRLADTSLPQQVYQKVVPAVTCCYASSGYLDELVWGAGWMYKLTQDQSYLTKANSYWQQLMVQQKNQIAMSISWDEKSGLAAILLASATANLTGTNDHSNWQTQAITFTDAIVGAGNGCTETKGGLYFCKGSSEDDSTVIAANAAFAVQMVVHQSQAGEVDSGKASGYMTFAQKQVDYILGNNPMKTPYIVGVHPNSPQNPHSAAASGGTDIGNIDTSPPTEAYIIYGALVGGPDIKDRFYDIRSDWQQNEIALDYNAPYQGLMAYQVMTSKTSPVYVIIPPGRPAIPGEGLPAWQYVVIVLAVLLGIAMIVGFIAWRKRDQVRAWRYRRELKKRGGVPPPLPYKSRPTETVVNDGTVEGLLVAHGDDRRRVNESNGGPVMLEHSTPVA